MRKTIADRRSVLASRTDRQYTLEYVPLSREAEKVAIAVVQQQPDSAEADTWRLRLLMANQPLVRNAAKPFTEVIPIADLMAEGNRGLLTAMHRFKPSYGTRFSTYAMHWVRACMLEATHGSRLIRFPVRWAISLAKVRRANSFRGDGSAENVSAIAHEATLNPREVRRCLALPQHQMFLNSVAETEDQIAFDLPISTDDPATALMRKEEAELPVQLATRHLPDWDAKILLSRYGIGVPRQTLDQLATTHRVSRETIRKRVIKSLARLKASINRSHTAGMVRVSNWRRKPGPLPL